MKRAVQISKRSLSTTRLNAATATKAKAGSTLADQQADQTNQWKGTATDGSATKLYYNGQFVESKTNRFIDVTDPTTQRVLTRVPEPTKAELKKITETSHEAWLSWRDSSVLTRQRVMLNLQALLHKHHDHIARSIVLEQGKTFADAKGDVLRGMQVVEAACGIPSMLLGHKLEVSKDMDTETRRVPLGVGAAICPFNFPAMIASLTFSRKSVFNVLRSLFGQFQCVLSIMHGSVDTVNYICDEPLIKAISFVGSDHAGKYIYDRGGANGKRVQSNLGAKNHAVLMPDANRNFAMNSIAGAAFGAAGQRCMALSVLLAVGNTKDWIPDLIERAEKIRVGNGFAEDADLGPVITPQAKAKIEKLIGTVEEEGGKILLDGRGVKVPEYPNGNWVGPSIVECTTEMSAYKEEIFGPVLTIVKADTFDDALNIVNRNRYGNGTAIFTQSGATARRFEREVEVGQIGINTPIPVPLPMFGWSGNKGSILGAFSLYGQGSLDFWTQYKTTTALWKASDAITKTSDVAMPTQR